ncbi:MAG: GldG family protein [bacterium]
MISRSTNFRTGLAVGAVLLIAIAIFLNRTLSNLGAVRLDLTQNKLYTVSPGAKHILSQLKVPVQVKYYVTPQDQMPAGLKTVGRDMADELRELSIASRGKLKFTLVNPSGSDEMQKALQAKGIRPFQVQSVEKDAVAVKLVYSSLAIDYKDTGEEIIPQVIPDNLGSMEYELLSRVLKLEREKQPIVAIYSTKESLDPQLVQFYLQAGQPLPQPQDNFSHVPDYLRNEGYDVRPVELTKDSAIPVDTKTLLLLGPKELNDRQRWEIYQVLKRGGSVVVATQATTYDYNAGSQGGFEINVRQQPVGINDLTSAFGVRIDDRMLMDAQMATLAIPRTAVIGGMRFQMSEPVQAPMQIRVMGESIRHDLPFTAGVPELLYLWGNQLAVDDAGLAQKGLKATKVFTGSAKSWIVDKTAGLVAREDIDARAHPMTAHPTLAVLLEGKFPDPWAGKAAPAWPAAAGDSSKAKEPEVATVALPDSASKPGRLLVIGCSKLFEDNLLEQAGHSALLMNVVDALTLGDDLISIRSKTSETRTFGEVSARKKLAFRFVNMAAVPLLLMGVGLGNWMRRRRDQEEYAGRLASSTGGSER